MCEINEAIELLLIHLYTMFKNTKHVKWHAHTRAGTHTNTKQNTHI